MDLTALLVFAAISFLVAVIAGFLLKWSLGRYVPSLLALPLKLWVFIIMLALFAAQGMGLPVGKGYAMFFNWLAKTVQGGF